MQIERRWLSYIRELPPGRKLLLGAIISAALSLTILAAGSRLVETDELHLWGALNDQIGYITVARNMLANGTVQGDSVLPSTLWQNKSRYVLYMPGHSATIALSYGLFGVGPFQALLPNLVSFLIGSLAIYFAGARIYSPISGLVASLLFTLFPPALFFAYTAMAELTFVAAFMTGVAIFLYLPERLRPWLGPLCMAVPFLFRETASLAVVPLGFYYWLETRKRPSWRPWIFVALSVLLLILIFRMDFSSGRPSLLSANVFGDWHAVYDDATAQQVAANRTLQDWLQVLPGRTVGNIISVFSTPEYAPWASTANYVILASMIFVGLIAVRRGDRFAWSLTVLNAVAATLTFVIVGISGYRGARHLMFTYALNVIVISPRIVKIYSGAGYIKQSTKIATVAASAAALLAVLLLGGVKRLYWVLANQTLMDRNRISLLVTILYAIVVLVGLVALVILWRRKRRPWDVEQTFFSKLRTSVVIRNLTASLIVVTFGLLVLSTEVSFRGKRFLFFAYTFIAIATIWLVSKTLPRINIGGPLATSALTFVLLFGGTVASVKAMFLFFTNQDGIDQTYAIALESIGHDDKRLLVTPFDVSVRYRYSHFPVSWAFLPYDLPTLKLLAARFDIGTMVAREDHPLLQDPASLAALGFYKDRELRLSGSRFEVYKRPPANGALAP
jgi:hypothetical protein